MNRRMSYKNMLTNAFLYDNFITYMLREEE